MDRQPGLVSVGIPVYNGDNYLAAALDSIVRQSYAKIEIIISDNGSSDATERICRRYAAQDRRIQYQRHEINRGASWNYNRVFERARGEYFKWWSHDDLCDSSYLEKCVEVLQNDPSVVICFPKTRIIDERGDPIRDYDDQMPLGGATPDRRFRRMLFRDAQECNAVFGLIRASVLEKSSLIGPYASSDRVLLAELALRGNLHQIPDYLFFRRDHPLTSTRVHPSVRSYGTWFDPRNGTRVSLPHWRLLYEYLAALRRGKPTPAVRLKCSCILLAWSGRVSPKLFKDLLIAAWMIGQRTATAAVPRQLLQSTRGS
jgi:glycosyltransferase involved in cell wall biosynthesis